MHDRFQKEKPLFIRCNATYSPKAEARLSKTQESKRDNKQPIGKQHADNQTEKDPNHTGGKGEIEEETGREKRLN